MSPSFNSLTSCLWPTEQSYSRLSQSESGEPGESLALANNATSQSRPPTNRASQLFENGFRNGHPPKSWRVILSFASNTDDIGKEGFKPDLNGGWDAALDIVTTDIVGLMKEGLYVSQDDVEVHENYITWTDNTEGRQRVYYRHYTLVHSKWSGKLVVQFRRLDNVPKFRVEHLSAEQVYHASAAATIEFDNRVYYYEAGPPRDRMNFILDDEPLPGLWPWPKQELNNRRESEESFDMVEM
ncbi:hypothetical protein FPOAC1_002799 [Fusarium poae]|uniref:Uncharacterized protein n=1 Tax=Fusarium poae TaxID=36050 RepID=A0A1B8B7M6_FUSPO|nr:hypothetical protein FPOAC1_002799 [Fusarium poae]KAG8676791.1 hypothetical protein FPOAC1_002799 [Fusarium poae]OBS28724.1 hypothetical protein FPOA_02662 [Fusarium poae]